MDRKNFIIIDSNAIIHRAFHALPPLSKSGGDLTNAVYGFLLVFLRVIKEFQPYFIVAAFDIAGPTFRHEEFKEYKATRKKAPDELYNQIPKVKEILNAFSIPVLEKEGFEADDIIGTISSLAKKNKQQKIESIIVSGDNDCLQLVDKNTKAYILKKGIKDIVLYDEEKVQEKYDGLNPGQLIDYKALRGDPSDNIPGVSGIGEKTAIQLIKKFKTLDNLYIELESFGRLGGVAPAVQEKLKKSKEQAYISRTLATIKRDVPIDFDIDECRWGDYKKEDVVKIFKEFEFYSLIDRIS